MNPISWSGCGRLKILAPDNATRRTLEGDRSMTNLPENASGEVTRRSLAESVRPSTLRLEHHICRQGE
jgi:hypothetical protein